MSFLIEKIEFIIKIIKSIKVIEIATISVTTSIGFYVFALSKGAKKIRERSKPSRLNAIATTSAIEEVIYHFCLHIA